MSIQYTNAEAKVIIELQESTPPTRWTRTVILDAMNDAVEAFQLDTQQRLSNKVFTVIASNRYTNPDTALLYTSGWYDNDDNQLKFRDRMDYAQDEGGTGVTGDPEYALEDEVAGEFMLYPRPTDTSKTFKMIFVKKESFDSTNDTIEIRDTRSARRALAFKTLEGLWRREGREKGLQKAMGYRAMYEDEVANRHNRSVFAKSDRAWPGGDDQVTTRDDYGIKI